MAVFLSLGAAGAALLTLHLHQRGNPRTAVSPYGPAMNAVVFNIDGANPADLALARMPNLAALSQNGVTYSDAWVGQAEATPAASGASIGTGAFPGATGIPGDVWFDAKARHVVRPTTPDQVLVGSLDAIMEPRGLSPLAARLKVRQPEARILSVGGTNCAAASAAGTWVADYVVCAARRAGRWIPVSVAGHALPARIRTGVTAQVAHGRKLAPAIEGWALGSQDDWIAREAAGVMRATRPRLTIVSLPELGALGEYAPTGFRSQMTRRLMRGIDRDIGVIVNEIKREGMYGRTVFVITAARAMAPILTASPFAQLGSAVVAAGGEPVYITGDHAAFIGLQDPLQAQPVAQAMLNGHTRNVDAVYFKSQSGNAWSYQPQYLAPALPGRFQDACTYLLDTAAGAGAPDVVVVYRPGAGLQPAPSSGFTRSAGALGLQWEDQHIPLIIAGHGVYSGRDSSYPARLVDIAPTLEALLGLPTGSGDGVVLQDALYQSAGGEAAQQAEANRLTPLVTALRTRAGR